MPQCKFNDYFNTLRLENSLFLAYDKIRSLECLMASKDHIIYQMISCNAFMARSSTTFSPPPPPLPTNPSDKKKDDKVDDLFQAGAGSKRSKSRTRKNNADSTSTSDSRKATASAKLKATADLKAADQKSAADIETVAENNATFASISKASLKLSQDQIAKEKLKAAADKKSQSWFKESC